MENVKLGKIKVIRRNDPKKRVIAFLKDVSKGDTLDKIRDQLKMKNKMGEDYFFVDKDKDNDILDKDLENDYTLEDILREDNGSLRIFLSQKDQD